MITFDQCNVIVGKVVREVIIGTGLQLLETRNVLSICEDRDSYEFRIGLVKPWMRVIRRVELAGFDCIDEKTMIAAVQAGCELARCEIASELRSAADRMAPK